MKKILAISMVVMCCFLVGGCKTPANLSVEQAEVLGQTVSSTGSLAILSASKAQPELCENVLGLLVAAKPAIQNLSEGQTLTLAVYPAMVERIKQLYPNNESKQQVLILLVQSVLSSMDVAIAKYSQYFTEKDYYVRVVNKVFDGTIQGINAYLDSKRTSSEIPQS